MTLNEDINLGAITEALNNKIDLPTGVSQQNVRVVVETYQNNTDWYRVYSDGWCEQGGKITIDTGTSNWSANTTLNLQKEYKDTNYNVIFHGAAPYSGNGNGINIVELHTSYFIYKGYNLFSQTDNIISWTASGYINLGGS